MSLPNKPQLIGYLIAIFAAGAVAGGVWGYTHPQQKPFRPQPPGDFAGHLATKLQSQLNLSEKQVLQIKPILQETAAEVCAAQKECGGKIREIFVNSNKRMAQFLTPEQVIALDEMNRRADDRFRKGFDKRGFRAEQEFRPKHNPATQPGVAE